ncbi:hypothetical protein KI387_036059 [Taxus chinensis]|uniref:Protein kinase domain-containing protein n=1 Tax=Taxus chinensis TaxID=29808 RepID=A0AA38KKA2_TAXCH|nr:hypothetical protein KI387_036059 [Taxus chinensis]
MGFILLVCTILCVYIIPGWGQIESDANVLLRIKQSLQGESSDNILLSSWNASVPLCQWRCIKWAHENGVLLDCKNNTAKNVTAASNPPLVVYSIELAAAGLGGTISKDIGRLSHLEKLYLGVNRLTGPIPLELGNSPRLSSLSLTGNKLNGSIPPSIWNLCGQLVDLLLDGNDLSGSIPEPAFPNVACPNLQILDFSDNHLEGPVPMFLKNFGDLQELDLSNNSLSGTVPEALARLNLSSLNLSHNNLSGFIPLFSQSFGNESFAGNDLCGSPLASCAEAKAQKHSGLSSGAVAGIVIALMATMVVFLSLFIGLGNKKLLGREDHSFNEFEDEETAEARLVLFEGGEHLTVDDVLNATGQVLGKTSYGTVYKAKLTQGVTIALRLLREGTCKDLKAFLPVVKDLGRLRHENIVPLRAFYEGDRGEKLLVYDYLFKGNLAELLHDARGGRPALSWARRHKIALGAARGLAHLHTGLETPVIHGNLKSKNVLVDEYYVAHLTDYGLDRLMTPLSAAEMMNASSLEGYKAPELLKMKKANTKTDIYNFGILLLEILIGKRPGRNDSSGDVVDLPSIVKNAVLEESTLELFDVEILRGMRSPMDDGLLQALQLAMGCCAPSPSVRPDIKLVIRQLEEIRPKSYSALYTPTESRSELELAF